MIVPDPELWVLDAEPLAHAAMPTLAFTLRVRDLSEREVYTIALKTEIHIEPARRSYDADARDRLTDLFGDPEQWGSTPQNLVWDRRDVLVPRFTGTTRFQVQVPCGADAELAAVKYFAGLRDGEAPLIFHFSGTILYCGPGDRLQVGQVPWSQSAEFKLPIETWASAVERHWPTGGFLRMGGDTLDALGEYRRRRGLPSLEASVARLLDEAEVEAR